MNVGKDSGGNRNQREGDWDRSTDERFFDYYAEASATDAAQARFQGIAESVLSALPDSQKQKRLEIADIGGGAGTLSRILAKHGHHPTCIDLSADLLDEGRKRAAQEGLDIEFVNDSATDLPFPDASFDVVFMPELLEHVEDWEACVNEATRVLRPGGALYLSTTNALCPVQHEFRLPLYSWYPAPLKRYYEKRAITDRPELANYARYPAVHWFTVYGLRRALRHRGLDRFLDRADFLRQKYRRGPKGWVAALVYYLPPLRLALQFATSGSQIVGFKASGVGPRMT